MMFRSYSNTSEFLLRDNVAIATAISRLVKITSPRVKVHLVFHWCLHNKSPSSILHCIREMWTDGYSRTDYRFSEL